jgi:hypothetical protein
MGTRRFVGAGGGVFDIDVPLSEVYQYQFDKGFLRLAPGENPVDEPDQADTDVADAPAKPARVDPKADWVTYAELVSDLPRDELEGMTKAQLVAQFG